MRNRPPAMRIRSRPEISWPSSVKSGAVRLASHASIARRATRMNMARKRPSLRAKSRRRASTFSTRIEMKMTLSIPRTSSSAVSVTKASHARGSVSNSTAVIVAARKARILQDAVKPHQRERCGEERERRRDRGEKRGDFGLLALHHQLRVEALVDFLQVRRVAG